MDRFGTLAGTGRLSQVIYEPAARRNRDPEGPPRFRGDDILASFDGAAKNENVPEMFYML